MGSSRAFLRGYGARTARLVAVVVGAVLLTGATRGASAPPDGTLDTTFDGDGRVFYDDPGTAADRATGVGVSQAGNTLFAARLGFGGGAVALTPGGSLLGGYGSGNGTRPLQAGWRPAGAAVLASETIGDGKIIIAGTQPGPSGDDIFVVRLTATGAPDTTFSGDGVATFTPSAGADEARAMVIDAGGRTVVTGMSSGLPFVFRTDTDGPVDTTCDGDGFRLGLDFPGSGDQVRAIAVNGGGGVASTRIAIAGSSSSSPGSDTSDIAVALLDAANCAPVPTFASGGFKVASFGLIEAARAVAIQPDGRVLVAGSARSTVAGSDSDFVVARFEPDGDLDPTCGGTGKVLIDLGGNDEAQALAVQPDGKTVLAGIHDSDVGVARIRPTDCRVDTTFDGDGVASYPISGTEGVSSVAVSPVDGKILVAGDRTVSGNPVAMVMRIHGGSGIFADDFESGGSSGWAVTTP